HIANLLTVAELIDSREKRNKLALTSGAVAADMETQFIARTCAARGIPLLSLRVISDTPRELFPASADVLFDIERQRTPMPKLARYFLAPPNWRSTSKSKPILRARHFSTSITPGTVLATEQTDLTIFRGAVSMIS